jgi:hypothetical protein
VSDRSDLPAPIEALVRAVAGPSVEADERASAFARGVALGALVGAAIAGSAIWQRRQATRPRPAGDAPHPAAPGNADTAREADPGLLRR